MLSDPIINFKHNMSPHKRQIGTLLRNDGGFKFQSVNLQTPQESKVTPVGR